MQSEEDKVYKFDMFLGSGSFTKEFSVKSSSSEEAIDKAEEAMNKVIKDASAGTTMDEIYSKISKANFNTESGK